MSLSSWEHQILSRIAEELSRADAKLAALLTGFNRLAASEEMPPRPQVPGLRRSRRPGGYRRRRHATRTTRWLTVVWIVTTAALIAVALVLNLFGPGTGNSRSCAQPRATSCPGNGVGALSVLSLRPGS